MSKKQLNSAAIASELRGQSAFFPARPAVAPDAEPEHTSESTPPISSTVAGSEHEQQIFPAATPQMTPPIDSNTPSVPSIPTTAAPSAVPNPAPIASPTVGTDERTIPAPIDRSNDRPVERTKVRHSFDVLSDQLISLREIALEREKVFGSRVLIGDLVQEALDAFITRERNGR